MLRLVLITISSIICCGIGYGGGLFAQIFAGAGVGSWLCKPDEGLCDKQFVFVSEAYSTASSVSLVPTCIAGLIYDRAGGRVLGGLGCCFVALGCLALQIPLLGAQRGHDEHTSGYLVWALTMADWGAAMVNLVPMTMSWHLSEAQTLVSALAASTIGVAHFLPLLISALMHWTGASLSAVILVWFLLIVLASVCLYCTLPTLSEYRAEAENVLGRALPRADPAWKIVKDGFAELRLHWPLHLLYIVAFGGFGALSILYTSLLGDWCMLLFGSSSAGKVLGTTFNILVGISSVSLGPLLACAADKLKRGTLLLLLGVTVPALVASASIGLPSWPAQIVTCAAMCLSESFQGTVSMKYTLASAGPTLFGTVSGLLVALQAPVLLGLQTLDYAWMSRLPSSSSVHLRLPLQATCIFQAICLAAWSSRLICKGLPEMPKMSVPGRTELLEA